MCFVLLCALSQRLALPLSAKEVLRVVNPCACACFDESRYSPDMCVRVCSPGWVNLGDEDLSRDLIIVEAGLVGMNIVIVEICFF